MRNRIAVSFVTNHPAFPKRSCGNSMKRCVFAGSRRVPVYFDLPVGGSEGLYQQEVCPILHSGVVSGAAGPKQSIPNAQPSQATAVQYSFFLTFALAGLTRAFGGQRSPHAPGREIFFRQSQSGSERLPQGGT
jgi:hypothetical protein